jgi:hypothetical protein
MVRPGVCVAGLIVGGKADYVLCEVSFQEGLKRKIGQLPGMWL